MRSLKASVAARRHEALDCRTYAVSSIVPVTGPAPRLLFVPVSGPYGMGEYARSLAIARAAHARWPQAAVHFLLSARAPYAAATPFPHTLLPASPTLHTPEVVAAIAGFRPDVVIFDNAGRSAQLAAARRAGARVIYISSRARQRRKGFRWLWMRILAEHWIAYPAFIAGAPRPLERLKLRLLGRPRLRYLDYILAPPAASAGDAAATPLAAGVLVVPGGGTGHPGARDAIAQFHGAAVQLGAEGIPTTFVGPVPAGAAPAANVEVFASLPQADLAARLRRAALVVVNGGDTLLQAIACGLPCVAVPIAKDQHARIRRCAAAGIAVAAALDARQIADRALGLWRDTPARTALAGRAAGLQLRDGIAVALDGIAAALRPAAESG